MQIHISSKEQQLYLLENQSLLKSYTISTAANGLGEVKNTNQTPRGWHIVRAKIGSDCAKNTVFVGRRPTGEIYSPTLSSKYPDRDWILTRILWLSGVEIGKNRLGNVDTMQRYIYIHGGADDREFGVANSAGCIRMKNDDIIELFDMVQYGIRVFIE